MNTSHVDLPSDDHQQQRAEDKGRANDPERDREQDEGLVLEPGWEPA